MSHASVPGGQQTDDGTEAYLGRWQPANPSNERKSSVTSSPLLEQSKQTESQPLQVDSSEPPQTTPSIVTTTQNSQLIDESAEPAQQRDDEAPHITSQRVGMNISAEEEPQTSDVAM